MTSNSRAIFVLGPSSSGKSTLCEALASKLRLPQSQYIKEVARNVMRVTGYTRKDTNSYAMQHAIMVAQLEAETAALQKARDAGIEGVILLSDRSAIDPIVYAITAEGDSSQAAAARDMLLENIDFQESLPFYRDALFIVLGPVKEWIVDDGVRSLEDPERYNNFLRRLLHDLEIPFIEIGDETRDLRTRVELVINQLVR